MKKGLAVIYDPHNVYQFLWYYCTYGKDVEWHTLCLPNSYKGEYLSSICEKIGIFKEIYRDTHPFDSMPLVKRMKLFVKMFLYAIIGRQKIFSKNFIKSYTDDYDFDIAVVLTDVGFISGLFLTQAPEKEIIILEDGMGDYEERRYSNILKRVNNFFEIQGFILAMLGYSNIGHYYPLRTTKNCFKFCSHPDKMKYKKYKDIKLLFDMKKTDVTLFKNYLDIVYPGIQNCFKNNPDLILFTTPIKDYISDDQQYVKKIQNYINEKYKNKRILLKKHPRDNAEYVFSKEISVIEIKNSIPAEILLPYIGGMDIIFCDHSSTNLYSTSYGYIPKFFYFTNLAEENIKQQAMCRYVDKEDFISELEFFGLGDCDIILL